VHTHQVVDDGVDVPVWQIGREITQAFKKRHDAPRLIFA
jgi:hypothetical protein